MFFLSSSSSHSSSKTEKDFPFPDSTSISEETKEEISLFPNSTVLSPSPSSSSSPCFERKNVSGNLTTTTVSSRSSHSILLDIIDSSSYNDNNNNNNNELSLREKRILYPHHAGDTFSIVNNIKKKLSVNKTPKKGISGIMIPRRKRTSTTTASSTITITSSKLWMVCSTCFFSVIFMYGIIICSNGEWEWGFYQDQEGNDNKILEKNSPGGYFRSFNKNSSPLDYQKTHLQSILFQWPPPLSSSKLEKYQSSPASASAKSYRVVGTHHKTGTVLMGLLLNNAHFLKYPGQSNDENCSSITATDGDGHYPVENCYNREADDAVFGFWGLNNMNLLFKDVIRHYQSLSKLDEDYGSMQTVSEGKLKQQIYMKKCLLVSTIGESNFVEDIALQSWRDEFKSKQNKKQNKNHNSDKSENSNSNSNSNKKEEHGGVLEGNERN